MAGRWKKVRRRTRRIRKAAAVAAGVYLSTVRPWTRTWGATDSEVEARLPGDEHITHPRVETTRAITIEATPEEIWPWLARIGQERAGFYNYDWVEKIIGGDPDLHDQVLEAFQGLDEGDLVRINRERDQWSMRVVEVRPERDLVLRGSWVPGREAAAAQEIEPEEPLWLDCTWAFALQPGGDHTTRLISRLRVDHRGIPMVAFVAGFLEPAHFLVERKMLLGIKERAQQAAQPEEEAGGADEEHVAGEIEERERGDEDAAKGKETAKKDDEGAVDRD